jgi:outer membrane receptor protein involved in Fe transport
VFNTLYHFDTNPVYTAESVGRYRSEYINQGIIDSSLLEVANFAKGKPETMSSYEIGYRGVINTKLFIDAYYYFSTYKNFIGRQAGARADNRADLLNPLLSTNFSFVVNSSKNVNANGWGIGADYQIGKGYMITANIFSDQLTNVDSTFITFFNTPKTRFNIGLSNSNLGKGFGFNIIYRWQDKTYWESTFGTGEIPAYGTLDAQVSYHFTKQKVLIKLGGTNITNHYYRNAFGNPYIGGLYYVSMGFDIF